MINIDLHMLKSFCFLPSKESKMSNVSTTLSLRG